MYVSLEIELLEQIKEVMSRTNNLLATLQPEPTSTPTSQQPVNMPVVDVQGSLVTPDRTIPGIYTMNQRGKCRFQVIGTAVIPAVTINKGGPYPLKDTSLAVNEVLEAALSAELSDTFQFSNCSVLRVWSVPRA